MLSSGGRKANQEKEEQQNRETGLYIRNARSGTNLWSAVAGQPRNINRVEKVGVWDKYNLSPRTLLLSKPFPILYKVPLVAEI